MHGSFGFCRRILEAYIVQDPIYKNLAFVTAPTSPFKPSNANLLAHDNIPTIAWVYAKLRGARGGIRDEDTLDAVAMGELFAFDLPVDIYVTGNAADELEVETVRSALCNNLANTFTNLTATTYAQLLPVNAAPPVPARA